MQKNAIENETSGELAARVEFAFCAPIAFIRLRTTFEFLEGTA